MSSYYDIYFDPSVYTSPVAGDGSVTIHTGACKLIGFKVLNVGVTGVPLVYAQVHDVIGVPSASVVPIATVVVPSGVVQQFDANTAHWVPIATGLTVAASSTSTKYTAVGSGMFLCPLFYTT